MLQGKACSRLPHLWWPQWCAMTECFLRLWLSGADALIGLPYLLATTAVELQSEQTRVVLHMGEWAVHFWDPIWTAAVPQRHLSTSERMALLSLRVVQGGRC